MTMHQDPAEVRRKREAILENGYSILRVRTHGKAPAAVGWQSGEEPDALLNITKDTANTGMICCGLQVLDIDVDDPAIVAQIVALIARHLPRGAMLRRRGNSSRLAAVFRAEGQPKKRIVVGVKGKVEILGNGQQLVIDGVHPSGVQLEWVRGRSPATVPFMALPIATETQIAAFLRACAPILGVLEPDTSSGNFEPVTSSGNFPLRPAVSAAEANELSGGLESAFWFDQLSRPEKHKLVKVCLDAIDNRLKDPRDQWIHVLFAAADAAARGCPDAEALAMEWSKQGKGWTSEQDFSQAWNSFRPGRITVGTLLHMGQEGGVDLAPWRTAITPQPPHSMSAGVLAQFIPALSPTPLSGGAVPLSALPALPPKRKYLYGTYLVRGAVSLLVAPGARGKSTWLLTVALACACGRALLGTHVFGGPLRVLYINAEDSTNELALRVRAAMQYHGLKDSDVAGLHIAGADHLHLTLLTANRGQPSLNSEGWNRLNAEVDRIKPDIVLIDPLVALVGGVSLNDNSAAALMVGNFVAIAAQRNLAIMIAHHAAKNREATSPEAAMGAATLVNLARICLSLEPLAEADAGKIGVAPWDARFVFRIVGTKQNLSPPNSADDWVRLRSVDMLNAEPPIYPQGDSVAVVERFIPNPLSAVFPAPVIASALHSIGSASPPLSPFGRAAGTSAVAVIGAAIAPHLGGKATNAEAKAVLDYLMRSGKVASQPVQVPRLGRGPYTRNGLVVTATQATTGAKP
ncbi:AAA family ATPase [Bradyrhizobium barranii]